MTLADRQRSYRGLTLGGMADPFQMVSEEGLEDFDVRDGDQESPRDDGAIPGMHLVSPKTFIVECWVAGDTGGEVEAHVAAFGAAFRPSRSDQFEYRFKNPGQAEKLVRCRPLRRIRRRDQDTETRHVVELLVAMKATDPRIYSVESFQDLVPIFEVGEAGIDAPVNAPVNLNAPIVADVSVINAGGSNAYPILQFQYPTGGTGTCTGLLVTNQTNGSTFEMGPDPGGGAFALVEGQTLLADMDAIVRKVPDLLPIRIDVASRYTHWQFPRAPFYLSSGTNVLTFEPAGSSTDIVCLAQWRNTDL